MTAKFQIAMLALAGAAVLSAPAFAENRVCKPDEVSIPDDREGGGNLCMPQSEWDKAKKICGEGNDPMGCVCQDADTVGACGD